MTDIIVRPNDITIDITEGQVEIIQPPPVESSVVVETTINEPLLLISQGERPFPDVVNAAREIEFLAVAGEDISALKFVYLDGAGLAFKGFYDTKERSQVVGITKTAGLAGDMLRILAFGRIDDLFFTVPSGTPIYLTVDGGFSTIAPTAPLAEYLKDLGQGLELGSLFVNIKEGKKLIA